MADIFLPFDLSTKEQLGIVGQRRAENIFRHDLENAFFLSNNRIAMLSYEGGVQIWSANDGEWENNTMFVTNMMLFPGGLVCEESQEFFCLRQGNEQSLIIEALDLRDGSVRTKFTISRDDMNDDFTFDCDDIFEVITVHKIISTGKWLIVNLSLTNEDDYTRGVFICNLEKTDDKANFFKEDSWKIQQSPTDSNAFYAGSRDVLHAYSIDDDGSSSLISSHQINVWHEDHLFVAGPSLLFVRQGNMVKSVSMRTGNLDRTLGPFQGFWSIDGVISYAKKELFITELGTSIKAYCLHMPRIF